jgi:uncharacterized protein
MATLTFYQTLFCVFVLIGAFAVRGGTGFGAATVAVPLLALAVPVAIAVPVIAVLNVVNSAGMIRRDWRRIAWPVLLRLTPYTLLGIAVGLYVMSSIDEASLSRALGIFLLVYAPYAMWTAGRPLDLSPRWRTPLAVTAGTVGGFIGALFGGATGVIYAAYLNLLRLEKDVFRVTVTTIIVVGLLARTGGYAGLGLYDQTALFLLAAALPLMVLGSWLGDRVVQRFNEKKFGQLVGGVLLITGAALVAR